MGGKKNKKTQLKDAKPNLSTSSSKSSAEPITDQIATSSVEEVSNHVVSSHQQNGTHDSVKSSSQMNGHEAEVNEQSVPVPEPKVDISPQSDLSNIASRIVSKHENETSLRSESTQTSDKTRSTNNEQTQSSTIASQTSTTPSADASTTPVNGQTSSAAPRRASMIKRKFSERTQLAFLRDDDIKANWLFRIFNLISVAYLYIFHGFYFKGLENIPQDERGVLFIMRHSTHNADIYPLLFAFAHYTGSVPRGLVHRLIMKYLPFLRYLGSVPGERNTAEALLQSGFRCCVIPGGADEGLVGHENCYVVNWPEKRKGFAKVARESNAHIIPFVLTNVEEMRFNPFFWMWNKLRLAKVYNYIMTLNIPFLRDIVYQISISVWFCVSFFQIPIPAQLIGVFGPEVTYDSHHDSIDHTVKTAQQALQQLVTDAHDQRKGRSYRKALYMRWNYFAHEQVPQLIDFTLRTTETLAQRASLLWNTYSPLAKKQN